jgi:hypothetical protein
MWQKIRVPIVDIFLLVAVMLEKEIIRQYNFNKKMERKQARQNTIQSKYRSSNMNPIENRGCIGGYKSNYHTITTA